MKIYFASELKENVAVQTSFIERNCAKVKFLFFEK